MTKRGRKSQKVSERAKSSQSRQSSQISQSSKCMFIKCTKSYLHNRSCEKGRPDGKDIGGTFISPPWFPEFFPWSRLFECSEFEFPVWWAAAAAAASRAAILWAASTLPFPPPPAWAAATSASKSGRGFRSCENSGECWNKNRKKYMKYQNIFLVRSQLLILSSLQLKKGHV